MGLLERFDLETGPLLISLIITIPVIAYIYLKNRFNYWTKRGIPQVNPTSFLYGSIKDIFYGKEYSGDVLQKIYDQFKGEEFCGYYEFINPVLMVTDPQLIQTVLVEKFASFHDNKLSKSNVSADPNDVFSNHPFILAGSKWKESRSVIASAFTPNKLRSLEEIIKSVYKNMKVYIDKNSDCIQNHDLTSRAMCEVVAAWGWGIDAHAFQEKSVVKEIFDKINFIILSSFYLQLALFWPAVGNFFLKSIFPSEMSDPLKELTEQTITNSEKLKTSQSLLQTLLSIKEKNKNTDKELTKTEIIGHMATYYIDGYETTSRFLDYLLHQLVIHPDVQKKLREEISTMKEITIDGVTKLEYLDMVVSESGRVITLAPFLSKICTEKIKLGSKDIDVGTGITIPIHAIHHDSEYYPDPYKFNPENFSEENRNKRHKYTHLPFGQGPRACVGMRHAITDTKLIVCYLLKDYELLLPDDTPSEQLKPLKQSSILFLPDTEPAIRFKKL